MFSIIGNSEPVSFTYHRLLPYAQSVVKWEERLCSQSRRHASEYRCSIVLFFLGSMLQRRSFILLYSASLMGHSGQRNDTQSSKTNSDNKAKQTPFLPGLTQCGVYQPLWVRMGGWGRGLPSGLTLLLMHPPGSLFFIYGWKFMIQVHHAYMCPCPPF